MSTARKEGRTCAELPGSKTQAQTKFQTKNGNESTGEEKKSPEEPEKGEK